jgi:hypothetical protein
MIRQLLEKKVVLIDGEELAAFVIGSDQKEISELIEAGYEFVLQKDNLAYFRRRK